MRWTIIRAPEDGTGSAVAEAAVEATIAANEAVEAAGEARDLANEVSAVEGAVIAAEARAEAAEEQAEAIAGAVIQMEAERGIDELWRELDGLKERNADLESRVSSMSETLTLLSAASLLQTEMNPPSLLPETEVSSSTLPSSPEEVTPEAAEVPTPDLGAPVEKRKRRIRLL